MSHDNLDENTESQKRILIVEDDADIRSTLFELLEGEGYAVAAAENGEIALRNLAEQPRPHLILLDLMMPVKDGFEFRREQLQNPTYASVPVVIMSADGNIQQKQEQTHARAYLKKPVDLDTLLNTVKRCCD